MNGPITKATAHEINKQLQTAIDAVAARHGLRIRSCKLSYSATWIRIHSEIASIGAGGEMLDADAASYDQLAALMGLGNVPRGSTVRLPDGLDYTITGCNNRARKAPILVTRDGRTFAVPAAIVVAATKPGAGGV